MKKLNVVVLMNIT